MVIGVTDGFEKTLEINGVGYRAQKQERSWFYLWDIPTRWKWKIRMDWKPLWMDRTKIIVRGIDKEKVGQYAAEIRFKRQPEPYKGKGIKYSDEVIRRKEGKTGK